MTIREENEKKCNSYNFKVFDMSEINLGKGIAITITAKRNSGKTVLMRDLCYQLRDKFQEVYVFSNTAEFQTQTFDFVKKENIYHGLDEAKLEEIWSAQSRMILKLLKQKPEIEKNKKYDDVPKVLILFDDLIGDPNVRISKELAQLFTRGRHVFISLMFITQTIVGIPPIMRRNVDLAIAFYLENYDCRKAYSMQYLSTENVQLGMRIFERITGEKDKYQCIIKLNYDVSRNPEDYIRTYIAKLKTPKFKMGKDKPFNQSFFIDDKIHTTNLFSRN